MIEADALTFHVLFVPGTVQCLRTFTPSLAAWSGGSQIRLVSNGCSPAEDELLLQLVKLSPRFEFYKLAGQETWNHGAALSFLQRQETGPYFAFLDSDVFATGDFLGDLFSPSGRADALFSCPPIWSFGQSTRMPNRFQIANCPFVQMEDGFCFGSTYFAIYDNRILGNCMRDYGIDLCTYRWDRIPTAIQQRLATAGRKLMQYDTSKLVNVLLNLDGHSCQFQETQYLHHVGGVSETTMSLSNNPYRWLRRHCSAWVPDIVRQIGLWARVRDRGHGRLSWAEIRHIFAKCNRRRSVSAFVYRLLHTLSQGETPSVRYTSGDANLNAKMHQLEMLICQLYPTWSAWLTGREPIVATGAERSVA